MKAVVLAGGFATRLRPLSCTRPKILFPILNKPMLQWTFERLAKNNINEAIMAVFYQTEAYIKHHRVPRCGVRVTFSHDPMKKPLGTAGSIKKAEKLIGHESPFLVLNGDIFADADYTEIFKLHEKKKAVATIALHQVSDPSRYGVANVARDKRITEFIEKPRKGTAPTNLINAGVYVLSPEIFGYIPKGRAFSIEREVFPRLAEEKVLYGYFYDGLWIDIGKPEDYLKVNKIMLNRAVGQTKQVGKGQAEIMKTVTFGRNVSIGKESIIGPYTVLGSDVTVGDNVHIQDSVILPAAVICDHSVVEGSIVGEGVFIGKKAYIPKGCIIGDHARIRDNVSLTEGTSICPGNEVTERLLQSDYR